MSDEKAIVVSNAVQFGVIEAQSPQDVITRAEGVAKPLAKLINDRKLYTVIGGKKYVQVDGWSTLGAMLGVLPHETKSTKLDNGYEAYVDLVRMSDGMVVGGASAICTREERNWHNRDEYALKSMAATRATGKAYRLAFSWIMNLAGYESTPAEEMIIEAEVKPVEQKPVKPEPVSKSMTMATAEAVMGSDGKRYGDCTSEELGKKLIGIKRGLEKKDITPEQREEYQFKKDAVNTILSARGG